MTARRWLVLGGMLFVSYAYFYPAGGWNQNSRLDLIRSLVEQGTIRIDDYHENTEDKARAGGHVYSDKAPGQAFLAAPFVWAARAAVSSAAGISYLATLLTSGLPTVACSLLVAWAALRLGATEGGALFGCLVYGLGTPAWPYATLLWGHGLAACGLFAGFAIALALGSAGPPARDWMLSAGLGLAGGWATVTEYPAGPAAAIIAGLALAAAAPAGRRRLLRVAGGIAAGALPCAAIVLGYHAAAFGSPFATPLGHLVGFAEVRDTPFHVPTAAALQQILFGLKRGLLPLAPVLLAAPAGFVIGLARRGQRGAWLAAAAVIIYYLGLNASFQTPLAGWSYGPRYIAAALPFLALGLGPLFSEAGRAARWILSAAALAGMALSLVAVSTTPQPPGAFDRPVEELLWPAFRDGDLSLNHQSVLDPDSDPPRLQDRSFPRAAWNLGERMGLRGHASLVPLFGIWALSAAAMFQGRRRPGTRPDPGASRVS